MAIEIRMDIISHLPLEVSHHILLLLNADDVGRCCMVSKRWREIANHNHIWLKLCLSNGIDVNEVKDHLHVGEDSSLTTQCKWGRIFNFYFTNLISNWSNSCCKRFDIPYREAPRISTDGNTIVFGDVTGAVDVWNIKRGKPTLTQSLSFPRHSISKLLTNTDFFIAVVDTIYILVYQLTNGKYNLLSAFYISIPFVNGNIVDRFVYKKETQSLNNFIEERRRTLMVLTAGLFDNNLYLTTTFKCVFVWNLKPFKYVGEINFTDNDCAVRTSGDCLYVHYCNKIVVYNKDCVIIKVYAVSESRVSSGSTYLSTLHCSTNLVSAILGDYRDLKEVSRKLIVWDKNSCKELCQKTLLMYEYAFLHPTKDIVYIIHQTKGPKYIIKAWKPLEDRFIWLGLHSSELDSYHFNSVGCRFIIFFTHLNHSYFLYDSLSGRKSPLLINGSESSIIHYSNNTFILAETRSVRTFSIFSFVH